MRARRMRGPGSYTSVARDAPSYSLRSALAGLSNRCWDGSILLFDAVVMLGARILLPVEIRISLFEGHDICIAALERCAI